MNCSAADRSNGFQLSSLVQGFMLGLLIDFSIVPLVHAKEALKFERLWTADADMIMEGAPMVVDVNGDGDEEVLTAAYENIIVVDGTGKELWRFDTRGRYSTCPAIFERPGETPLIYAGDNRGLFTCLDGTGQVVWQAEMGSVFCSSPAAADLNNDGTMEVIQGNQAGEVTVLDALTGDVVWKKQLEGECACPAVGDIDGNGTQEIAISTGLGNLYVLDASGDMVWDYHVGSTATNWANPSPVIFADSNGTVCIATAAHSGRLICLDPHGGVRWIQNTRGPVASTISVGDIDRDGRADLFVVTELGVLYRFNEDGRMEWAIDTQGRSLAPGAILDVDGDGSLEYMLCTQQGNLLGWSEDGEILYNYQFDHRTINVTPAFGDILRDRPGLEFAITGGESGQVICFGTQAPIDTSAQWRTYRGDNRLSGMWFGLAGSDEVRMAPENLEWSEILTGEPIQFRIINSNMNQNLLKAQATCLKPDGSRQAAVGKVVGSGGVLQLPLAITAPGVYRFEWRLDDDSGVLPANGSQELTLSPYMNDRALVQHALLELQAAIGSEKLPENDKGLRTALTCEAQAIEEEAKGLLLQQTAAPGTQDAFREQVDVRTATLNQRAGRALALARVAASLQANRSNHAIAIFEGTMWENRNVDRQVPSEGVNPLRITRRCVPGEHEPVSIKLLNLSLNPANVSVRVKTTTGGPAVSVFEVKSVSTNQGDMAWDPIVPLNDERVVIPSLETREVWLDIDLADVKSGTYQIEATFYSGEDESRAEITLDVLPFEMAGIDAMRLCCWASYNEDAIEDLLAHGNTVFTASLPPVTVMAGDTPKIDVHFAALDEFIKPMAGHDVYLLMTGIPDLGVPMESEDYVPRLAGYLDQVLSHLKSKGIEEERVALYPHDEPGGHGWDTVNHYLVFARQGLQARPGLKFYVNGGGDLAMFQALNDVAAIWCPGFYMLPEKSPVMEFLRNSGKTLWTYDCAYAYARPIGANTKNINIVAQYRLAAVHGFHFGAEGIGYWCYNAGDSLWEPVEFEYPLVYANTDGTHTSSRRWEAVREGMEDARILAALRERLEDSSVRETVRERIRQLLEGTVSELSQQALAEARLGVARYALDASNNDRTVERLRTEMMDCVKLLVK